MLTNLGSENYSTCLKKMTPLFGMLFHICICGEALLQIGRLLQRIGNVSFVKQMAISKVAGGLICTHVLFQEYNEQFQDFCLGIPNLHLSFSKLHLCILQLCLRHSCCNVFQNAASFLKIHTIGIKEWGGCIFKVGGIVTVRLFRS